MAPRYGNPKQYSGSLFTTIKHILSSAPSPRTRVERRGWLGSSHLPRRLQRSVRNSTGRDEKCEAVGCAHPVRVLPFFAISRSLSFFFNPASCLPGCVYAPLPAGLSKCSPLTQNRSALSPAAAAKPRKLGVGTVWGERRRRNRDTF